VPQPDASTDVEQWLSQRAQRRLRWLRGGYVVVVGSLVLLPIAGVFVGLHQLTRDMVPFMASMVQGAAATVGLLAFALWGLPSLQRVVSVIDEKVQASAFAGSMSRTSSSTAVPGLLSAADAKVDLEQQQKRRRR